MIEQYSPEWWQARVGKVTGSRVSDLMAKTKTGWGASRANYMADLICERLTGKAGESYTSPAMQWGTDTEPQARAAYAFMTGRTVDPASFEVHLDIGDFGASPDGLIGVDGLLEIKCPNTATHLEFLLSKTVPGKYITQMQAQMACARREWCDFVSFDPRLPETMQMLVVRVERDGAFIAEMESAVSEFLRELDAKVAKLRAEFMSDETS